MTIPGQHIDDTIGDPVQRCVAITGGETPDDGAIAPRIFAIGEIWVGEHDETAGPRKGGGDVCRSLGVGIGEMQRARRAVGGMSVECGAGFGEDSGAGDTEARRPEPGGNVSEFACIDYPRLRNLRTIRPNNARPSTPHWSSTLERGPHPKEAGVRPTGRRYNQKGSKWLKSR